jgi:2-polyprenyl-3-methyl-5-hydroxy-6-metoxy-1,4-benzoquinol methylase
MRWKIAQWFERRWWKNYLKRKSAVEYLQWKQEYWKAFLDSTEIDLSAPGRVLDAGCGPAGIFIQLSGHQVTAIDPLLERYTKDLKVLDQAMYPWVNFQTIPIESFRADVPFAWVFCLNAINHVKDYPLALDQLVRATAPSGHFIMSIDTHRYRLVKWLFRAIPLDILHPHQYALSEYVTELESRGLQIINHSLLKSGTLFHYHVIHAQKT